MSNDTTSTAQSSTPPHAPLGGPKTEDGKRIAARNATTHGLFARDVVLPRLGEDPAAYEAFLQELTRQLAPKNLLEQHYAEKIAAASWRLRRLHRWQAQLVEDVELTEDEVLAKLDRVMRHETTLHRQIDTSVKMLARELPRLFEGRVREDLIRRMNETERSCKDDPYLDQWVTEETRRRSALPTAPPSLDLSRLDNALQNCQNKPAPCIGMADGCTGMACHAPTDNPHTNCQNEPSPAASASPSSPWQGEVARNEPEGALQTPGLPHAKCQNEPAPAPMPARPNPPVAGGPCDRGTREQGGGFLSPTLGQENPLPMRNKAAR